MARMRDTRDNYSYDSSQEESILGLIFDALNQYKLVWLLTKRELVIRYRRSALGILWALITPVLTSLVLYVVLDSVFKAKMPSGTGYATFLIAGMLVNSILNQGGNSVGFAYTSNSSVVSKVRTPKLLFPIVYSLSAFINFLFGVIPLLIFLIAEGFQVKWFILLIPIVGIFLSLFILGIGTHVAVFAARYQDIHGIMAVIYTIVGFATPIIYPLDIVQGATRTALELNPLTNYVQLMRFLCMDSSYLPSIYLIVYTALLTGLILWTAILRLRKHYSRIVGSL